MPICIYLVVNNNEFYLLSAKKVASLVINSVSSSVRNSVANLITNSVADSVRNSVAKSIMSLATIQQQIFRAKLYAVRIQFHE